MKFKKLNLYTNRLEEELHFYSNTLGFQVLSQSNNSFTVRIGGSHLTFTKSDRRHIYHYCFLIPCNKLEEALEWFEERHLVVDIDQGRKTQHFESWNADSFYFYDASGNIAECIVRYDLKNESNKEFDNSLILGVNEMGMPTDDINQANHQLQTEIKTDFWKGDFERFGTNGDQEGIFLLPNFNVKDIWFPTQIKIVQEPFEALVENNGVNYEVRFHDGNITTMAK